MEMNKWFINYGELVGKSHIPRNIPCQDKALCATENGVTVATVSDGCGSSHISQYGSQVTTQALCELFINKFDEIFDADILMSRKIIVDAIIEALKLFIEHNRAIFEENKNSNLEKYNEYTQKHSDEEFNLDALNATALFVAEKNNKYIIGQIGDGVIGGVVNGKLKVIMEEKKMGEVNGTFYPTNVYAFAQKDPNWYGSSQFQLKKPKNVKAEAFILTSDGVDSFFDLRIPFQKKYTSGVDKLFRCTVGAATFEESQKILREQFLPALVSGSRALDDCSVAVMVKDGYCIEDYEIVQYERPVEVKAEDSDDSHEYVKPSIEKKIREEEHEQQLQDKINNIVGRFGDSYKINIERMIYPIISYHDIFGCLDLYKDILYGLQQEKEYYVVIGDGSLEEYIFAIKEADHSIEISMVEKDKCRVKRK